MYKGTETGLSIKNKSGHWNQFYNLPDCQGQTELFSIPISVECCPYFTKKHSVKVKRPISVQTSLSGRLKC